MIQGKNVSEVYKLRGLMTTNVILTADPLPAGKQTFQVADPGLLMMSAKSTAPRAKAMKVPLRKYSNTNASVAKWKTIRGK